MESKSETMPMPTDNYYHWTINYLRKILPAGYAVMERCGNWPDFISLVYPVFNDQSQECPLLQKYKVELIDSEVPEFPACHLKLRWTGDIDKETAHGYWNYLDSRTIEDVLYRIRCWYGLIKISAGTESVYLCQAPNNAEKGKAIIQLIAYNNTSFMDTLVQDMILSIHNRRKKNGKAEIYCINGPDIPLKELSLNQVILPAELKKDIVDNTELFFQKNDFFEGLGIPRKRGFLLVGQPGNGKTFLCHAMAFHMHTMFNVKALTFNINASIDTDLIIDLYRIAAERSPALVIIEDIESLLTDTGVTRSGLLNVLDGLNSPNGVLTIATTNYPERLDPALAHRPSRFDRVWTIPLPDANQRIEYLQTLFSSYNFSEDMYTAFAKKTEGWSMAYIKELKTNAGVFAFQNNRPMLLEEDIFKALEVLNKQFTCGKKNHRIEQEGTKVGFGRV